MACDCSCTCRDVEMANKLKVQHIRELTPSTYVLRFDRENIPFIAGQHILLTSDTEKQAREYSIYNGEQDDYFEVLIKEVQEGIVSRELKMLNTGDEMGFEQPVGYFILKPEERNNKKYLFIASGTGIAPFHSFVKSYPELDYTLLHGVRVVNEAYDRSHYDSDKYVLCTSRSKEGDFHGRVTDYLKANDIPPDTVCYLCGNVEMIHDAYDILLDKGISSENIHAEVYF